MDGQSDFYYPLSEDKKVLCQIYMLYHQDAQMVVDYKYSGWIKKDYTEKALENQYSVEIQFFNVGNAYVNF